MADTRVLIADDEKVIREALADLIEGTAGMTVAAVAANAQEAIAAAARVRPDVALVDVRMPGGGPKATRGILEMWPPARVLALSASGGRDTVLEMLQAGAAGYLVKGILPSEVIAGIRQVVAGGTPLSPEVAGGVIDRIRAELDAEDKEHHRREELFEKLTFALDGDALDVVYQPIVDIETASLVGVEALARFALNPKRPPNEWFEAATDLGLKTRLEAAAVARAISRQSQLPAGVFMAVNLSPEALLCQDVLSAIPEGFSNRVVIELTEHTPVLDYQALSRAFAPLRDAGAALAIDDAGAGFASLRHILELAPQFIKLDISLTQKIEHDQGTMALAVALTSFAGAIDATIIAEGIETESQLEALRSLGIRLGQGYLFGKPGPIEQVAALARSRGEFLRAGAG